MFVKGLDRLREDLEHCQNTLDNLETWGINDPQANQNQELAQHAKQALQALPLLHTLVERGLCHPMRHELHFLREQVTRYAGPQHGA
ncbi:hypothetical protein KSC_105350 [Ktedonobacter sp. SOSP1-52]|uniref:hypothetical protein n=1 Tax=Ktedonobacter sp. SOSP1-52 TaxID=2778366 RepID=UPI001914DD31|nr:hypothetical protein [Ktedonobacter sp. SOSP1-52]GHO71643.1 hypothetical protein KSC_105350 [Ktedonobacter sp. SOSP1-52]